MAEQNKYYIVSYLAFVMGCLKSVTALYECPNEKPIYSDAIMEGRAITMVKEIEYNVYFELLAIL
jgi:hypothetical protein